MVQIGKKAAAGPKKGKKALTFTIDCSKPVEDKVSSARGAPPMRRASRRRRHMRPSGAR